MKKITAVIVGAGQSGLAFSNQLDARGIDHVILERDKVASAWRHQHWDSLRLLTPNWQSRLPFFQYHGSDPEGYMTAAAVADYLESYASRTRAPIITNAQVLSAEPTENGFRVETTNGDWICNFLIAATGACSRANVPKFAQDLPDTIQSLSLMDYKNPTQLNDGNVLIVGASASGAQLASEIQASGKQVILSVGEHVRLPRTYRGRDICWWMDTIGLMDDHYLAVEDINRARKVSSLQLMGSSSRRNIDLNSLMEEGIEIAGRLQALDGDTAYFSGALNNHVALADLKMHRLLENIDVWIEKSGKQSVFDGADRPKATKVRSEMKLQANLKDLGITTVLWATGYKPDYSWLKAPVFDRKGVVRHEGGISNAAYGLYFMGLPFMRRRKSSYIDGVGADAADLATHLASRLQNQAA